MHLGFVEGRGFRLLLGMMEERNDLIMRLGKLLGLAARGKRERGRR